MSARQARCTMPLTRREKLRDRQKSKIRVQLVSALGCESLIAVFGSLSPSFHLVLAGAEPSIGTVISKGFPTLVLEPKILAEPLAWPGGTPRLCICLVTAAVPRTKGKKRVVCNLQCEWNGRMGKKKDGERFLASRAEGWDSRAGLDPAIACRPRRGV